MEKDNRNKKKKTLRTVIIIAIIIIILLLLRKCSGFSSIGSDSSAQQNGNSEVVNDNTDEETKKNFDIIFVNIDGSELQKSTLEEGMMPSYDGALPSYSDDFYDYTFIGWDKELAEVTSKQVYTALYSKTVKQNANSSGSVSHTQPKPQPQPQPNPQPDPDAQEDILNAPTVSLNLKYDGEAHSLVNAGTTTSGTLEYALGNETEALTEYSTIIPCEIDAGTYTVWYRVNGGKDGFGAEAQSISVTIAKRSIVLTSPSASKTYDGTALTDTTIAETGDSFISNEGCSYEVTGSQTNAGFSKNTFTYELSGLAKAQNYDITVIEGDLVVEKAENTKLPDVTSWIVETVEPDSQYYYTKVTVSTLTDLNETVEYGMKGADDDEISWQSSPVFAGLDPVADYTFYARYGEKENYKAGGESTSLCATTCKANQPAPQAPVVASVTLMPDSSELMYTVSLNTITAKSNQIVQYTHVASDEAPSVSQTWYETTTFTAETQINSFEYFYARFGATELYNEGPVSQPSEKLEDYKICCFVAGTKIAMADGSKKNIEEIVVGDEVLTYNHELGRYENQKINIVFKGDTGVKSLTLKFEDGNEVSITNTHYLFEKENLKYVPISKENALSLIGNHFYSADAHRFVKLVDVVFNDELSDFYTLYTEHNFNYFGNGMLNISDDIQAYLNFYTFKEDLSVDMDALKADIAQYGLCEYSEEMSMSEEEFNMWNGKYANIIIGKGLMNWEDVEKLHTDYIENYQ